jgi:hypothetical protein
MNTTVTLMFCETQDIVPEQMKLMVPSLTPGERREASIATAIGVLDVPTVPKAGLT